MKFAFDLVDSVKKIVLPVVGGHHLTCGGPKENKNAEEGHIFSSSV